MVIPKSELGQHFSLFPEDIPCWSLVALLNILKYPLLTKDINDKWSIRDWTGAYPKNEYNFDNPIDACVKMIIQLKENE